MTAPWNETSRTLPAGLTCGHCAGVAFCVETLHQKPEDVTCRWDPGRFRLKVELHQEAVAGLAAYRGALEAAIEQACGHWCDADCGNPQDERMPAYCAWGKKARQAMSPDPSQAILARLTAGEVLATDIREALARRKTLEPKGAEDFQVAYLREVPCRVNVEIALDAYDKAVRP